MKKFPGPDYFCETLSVCDGGCDTSASDEPIHA